jgi:hypothetical protein
MNDLVSDVNVAALRKGHGCLGIPQRGSKVGIVGPTPFSRRTNFHSDLRRSPINF